MRVLHQLKLFAEYSALAFELILLNFQGLDLFVSGFGAIFKFFDFMLKHFLLVLHFVIDFLQSEHLRAQFVRLELEVV